MEKQYVPENLVFSVAGNVNANQVFDFAEKYFSHLEKKPIKQMVEKPKYIGGELIKPKKSLSQIQFVMGFESIPFVDEKYYTASVASAILGRGMSSRLFQNVREKLGLCYTITSFYEGQKEAGLFTIYSGTSPENVGILEDAILKELNNASQNIAKTELSKVLEQYKSSILFANESTSTRAQKGIANLLAFNRYITEEEIISKVGEITTNDIETFIRETISTKPTKVVYGNIKKWEIF